MPFCQLYNWNVHVSGCYWKKTFPESGRKKMPLHQWYPWKENIVYTSVKPLSGKNDLPSWEGKNSAGIAGNKKCPCIGCVTGSKNSWHRWCNWKRKCPCAGGVSGRKNAPEADCFGIDTSEMNGEGDLHRVHLPRGSCVTQREGAIA